MTPPLILKPIGPAAPWLVKAAAVIGLDYSRLNNETTDQFETHVIKKHGNPVLNGRATITTADFAKIPGIVQVPDMAIIGGKRRGHLCNAYAKFDNGMTYIYIDLVLNGNHNRGLRGYTFYKVTRIIDFEHFENKIIGMNDITDLSGAKKIMAAGGKPGGERNPA